MSDWAEGTSPLAIPSFGDLGGGLYDFGYQATNLPASEAAKTATQYESGGSGFDWNRGLGDLLGAWVTKESVEAKAAQSAPLQYRRAENGQLYVTDPAYRGTVGGAVGGIPLTWLLIGGAVLAVVLMDKD